MVWACSVEWSEEGDGTMGDTTQLVKELSLKRMVLSDVPGVIEVLKDEGPPSKPLKFTLEYRHHGDMKEDFFIEENHLNLLFKVCGELDDLKFKVEQMDQNITLLLALFSSQAQHHL